MMRILDLALKDLRQLTRDRKAFLFLLVMPLAFTLLFGFAFSGSDEDPRLPVGLVDADGSALSGRLVEALAASQVVRLETTETAVPDLEAAVADEELAGGIVIPAGFDDGLRRAASGGQATPLRVVATGQAAFTVESEVETAVSRLAAAVQTAHVSTETAVAHGVVSGAAGEAAHFEATLGEALAAWETPPAAVRLSGAAPLQDEADVVQGNYNPFAHSSPGMMAQFAIAGLISAAAILVLEKQNRSLQRLLTTNLSRGAILLGHFLAMFLMIFLQLAVLILFGQIALDLPYLGQPLATLAVTVATALFCASLGLLIGAVAKSEEQVIVYALIPMFVLAGLGGAWMPLEFTPETFQRVAYLTPIAWVMDGYKDILVRGLGVEAVVTAVLVLLGYTAVLFGTAVWRFRFD